MGDLNIVLDDNIINLEGESTRENIIPRFIFASNTTQFTNYWNTSMTTYWNTVIDPPYWNIAMNSEI